MRYLIVAEVVEVEGIEEEDNDKDVGGTALREKPMFSNERGEGMDQYPSDSTSLT